MMGFYIIDTSSPSLPKALALLHFVRKRNEHKAQATLSLGLGAVLVSLVVVHAMFWPAQKIGGWRGQTCKAIQTVTMLGVAAAYISLSTSRDLEAHRTSFCKSVQRR